MYFRATAIASLSLAALATNFASVQGHGLMEYPPSRNQICGVETKPHEVIYGNGGANPECAPAFQVDFNGGYQFMSVLTHDIGREGGRTNHVCGFDSETWQGGMTPWDTPMDWPTTTMTAGRNEIRWNIEWGPHFMDTEEFRYWITKPDFQFDAGQELSWDDFEEAPFCVLFYSDNDPTANADVVADVQSTRFSTYCDVPARAGRHVIYGEWGRNEWTYERFHGCIDVQFAGGAPLPEPEPEPQPTPNAEPSPPVTSPTPMPSPAPTPAPTPTPPPVLTNCNVNVREGRNAYHAGFDIAFDSGVVKLDFSGTGLTLSDITVDQGNFNAVVQGQTITLTAPAWISSSNPGYMGFNGQNVAALASFSDPVCTMARRTMLRNNNNNVNKDDNKA